MTLTILILSFILDGLFSNLISINSIFYPLFTLISLIVIYPYYNNNKTFYKHALFIGLAYDLIYTNTMVFYAFVFVLAALIISKLSILLTDNYVSLYIISILSIIIFRLVTYLSIIITGNMKFDINLLFKSIYSSLIANLIYVIVLNELTKFISKKLRIRKNLRY